MKKEGKGNFSNKTWSRKKADKATGASKKELSAVVAKTVQKEIKAGVKKQLAAISKKRKTDSNDEADADCCLVQMLAKPLDGFNYKQMELLSIKDKEDHSDEFSVWSSGKDDDTVSSEELDSVIDSRDQMITLPKLFALEDNISSSSDSSLDNSSSSDEEDIMFDINASTPALKHIR